MSYAWLLPIVYFLFYGWRWYAAARDAYPDWTPELEKRHGGIRTGIYVWGILPILIIGVVKTFTDPMSASPIPEPGTISFHTMFAMWAVMNLAFLNGLYFRGGFQILQEPPAAAVSSILSSAFFARLIGPVLLLIFVVNFARYYVMPFFGTTG